MIPYRPPRRRPRPRRPWPTRPRPGKVNLAPGTTPPLAEPPPMVELPWGEGRLAVPVPPGWRLLGTFAPAPIRPPADPGVLCRAALARPIGAAPLDSRDLRGKRVLVVADDRSRPTPVARFFGS